MSTENTRTETLKRELGIFGAMMMGLGSIVGTGVFVSIGIAAGIAGPAVILAIGLAAFVAMCNAFSSAQLAASHPVSGGTYEYGYEFLHPIMGFTAGWMFLCAKSASAATAALGFAGYFLHTFGLKESLLAPLAAGITVVLTLAVVSGIRRSNVANTVIVSVTLVALSVFVFAGAETIGKAGTSHLSPFFVQSEGMSQLRSLLYATAMMFVAYTGYGRIATLGEEVREPRRTIPRAIVLTLVISAVLYLAVGAVAIGVVGSKALAEATQSKAATLEVVAKQFARPGVRWIVAVGGMTAMLGVLLNLILGLSRVLLAMGRRRDMPGLVARLNKMQTTPTNAVLCVGCIITGLACIGSVQTTWSFSAFTVLVYYAITNLCALRQPREELIFPRFFAWCGLAACLFLAFWVDWWIWLAGLGLIAAGLAWHLAAQSLRNPDS
ncbi:MAG: APC family permease [Planctomycetota bacterium]|nr:APC family permease [Planctomycetota bacterium]